MILVTDGTNIDLLRRRDLFEGSTSSRSKGSRRTKSINESNMELNIEQLSLVTCASEQSDYLVPGPAFQRRTC